MCVDLNLSSYFSLALKSYKSSSQIARIVTERWADDNLYCPRCGLPLHQYKNNTKVYDFYCDHGDKEFLLLAMAPIDNFQLKSTKSFPYNYFPGTITGAEYYTTLRSLEKGIFPSLILLHYERKREEIQDGLLVHRLSITPSSIRPRVPLSERARRKNWIGTDIMLHSIPQIGRIPVISESTVVPKEYVMERWSSVERILKGNLEKREWLSDMMLVLDKLSDTFALEDIYAYQSILERLHPKNKHVKDKIRQQLQYLRDEGYLKFVGRGRYQKLENGNY